MLRKVDVPVLGIIENMSYFTCPNLYERSEIFAHGGAKRRQTGWEVIFSGKFQLISKLETSDGGNL